MKLIELLDNYNFRQIDINSFGARKDEDTDIIRIYYGDMLDYWFEFGIWDFSPETTKHIKRIISKDILNAKVLDFRLNKDLNTICINIEYGFEE